MCYHAIRHIHDGGGGGGVIEKNTKLHVFLSFCEQSRWSPDCLKVPKYIFWQGQLRTLSKH